MIMIKEKIIVCVDAGGTSSKAAIFKTDGEIIARGYGKSGSPAVSDNWYLHIDEAIDNALLKINLENYQIFHIQIGVSGISALNSYNSFEQYFANKYQSFCIITSDTLAALYSVIDLEDQEGIVVISGTGVGIFGKNKDNETYLIGGWGHMIREYGSSYSLVHNFCVNLINHYEDTGMLTNLEKNFLDNYNISTIRELNHLFYQNTKDEIASMSTFFKEAANEKNMEAIKLLKEQGNMLGKQVKNLIRFLNLSRNAKIGLRGGFLENDGKYIINGLYEYFNLLNIQLVFEEESNEQLLGVYRLAIQNIKKRCYQ